MKTHYLLIASALAGVTVSTAFAGANPQPFTVDPTDSGQISGSPTFTASAIYGNYLEAVQSSTPTSSGTGTFALTSVIDLTNFELNNQSIRGGTTGLGGTYDLYAVLTGTGTYSLNSTAETFTFNSGTINIYQEYYTNSQSYLDTPANQTALFGVQGGASGSLVGETNINTAFYTSPDTLLATGAIIGGANNSQGTETLSTIGYNNGSYGVTSALALTAAGKDFFTGPIAFYNRVLGSGDLSSVSPSLLNQDVYGNTTVVFNTASVPLPSAIWLLASALAGIIGFNLRKPQYDKLPISMCCSSTSVDSFAYTG